MIIKPLEQVYSTEELTEREQYWIKELGTLYPYGGNERLDTPYIDAADYFIKGNCVYDLFNNTKSHRGKRGSGKSKSNNTNVDVGEIIQSIIKSKYQDENFIHFARCTINKLKKHHVLLLAQKAGK